MYVLGHCGYSTVDVAVFHDLGILNFRNALFINDWGTTPRAGDVKPKEQKANNTETSKFPQGALLKFRFIKTNPGTGMIF